MTATSSPDLRTVGDRLQAGTLDAADALKVLFGADGLWWRHCRRACEDDPGWLFSETADVWLGQIQDWDRPGTADAGWSLRDAAGMVLDTARALAGDAPGAETATVAAQAFWSRYGADVPHAEYAGLAAPTGLGSVRPALRPGVERTLGSLVTKAGESSAVLAAVTALLLAGAETKARQAVRLPVVFGGRDAHPAVTAHLILEEFPAGPPGLFPDPRSMATLRGTDAFWTSIRTAWHYVDPPDGRCVLWRIELHAGDLRPFVDGGSLGAAFVITLRELLRRPLWRRLLRRLRHGTALTGQVDERGTMMRIGEFGAKYVAVRKRRWTLMAPAANRPDRLEGPERTAPIFVPTVDEADRRLHGWRRGTASTTAMLLAATAAITVFAVRDHVAADQERRANTIAQTAQSLLTERVDLAQLFAVSAYHTDQTPQTRRALFASVTASPHFVRAYPVPGSVTAIDGTGDGHGAAVGTTGGAVLSVRLTDGKLSLLDTLPGPVTTVAVNANGSVVAAAGEHAAIVWTAAGGVLAIPVQDGWTVNAVAVSPSGETVAAVTSSPKYDDSPTITRVATASGELTTRELTGFSISPSRLAFADDTELVAFDGGGYGTWQRIRLGTLTPASGATAGFGVRNLGSALSPGGGYFTYTNDSNQLPVWPSAGQTDVQAPPNIAATGPGATRALAISADGSHIAKASDTNTIYVSRAVDSTDESWFSPANQYPPPVELTGAGMASSVTFLGGGNSRLLSATDDVLDLWDLDQQARIAASTTVGLRRSCTGCSGPTVAVNATGEYVAVSNGNGNRILVQRASPPYTAELFIDDDRSPRRFGPPAWTPDGAHVLTDSYDGGIDLRAVLTGLPIVGGWSPSGATAGQNATDLLAVTPDGSATVQVKDFASVEIHDSRTGDLRRTVSVGPNWTGIALDEQVRHFAVLRDNGQGVVLVDLVSGATRTLPAKDATGVAFAGSRLLVQQADGRIELYDAESLQRLKVVNGKRGAIGLSTNGAGLLAELDATSATVIDLDSGETLGTFALPVHEGTTGRSGAGFAPGGRRLTVVTERVTDSVLATWNLDPATWLATACATSGRNLTAALWASYSRVAVPDDLRCRR